MDQNLTFARERQALAPRCNRESAAGPGVHLGDEIGDLGEVGHGGETAGRADKQVASQQQAQFMAEPQAQGAKADHVRQSQQLERLFLQAPHDREVHVLMRFPRFLEKLVPFQEIRISPIGFLRAKSGIEAAEPHLNRHDPVACESLCGQSRDVWLAAHARAQKRDPAMRRRVCVYPLMGMDALGEILHH